MKPDGGYFFWLELDDGRDAMRLKKQSARYGTGLQPGPVFSHEKGFTHFIRLSFAHYRRDQIRDGVNRLAQLLAAR